MSFLVKRARPLRGGSFLSSVGSWLWRNVGKPIFGKRTRSRSSSMGPTTTEGSAPTTRTTDTPLPPKGTAWAPPSRKEGVIPKVLKKVLPAVVQWSLDTQKAQQATDLAKEEAEKAAALQRQLADEAIERQYTDAQMRAQQRANEREELAEQYRSEQGESASRQQAAEFTTMMAKRYPNLFKEFPQYMGIIEGQALGALMAPADPSDPLYAQKALGEIEYNLSLAEARVRATAKAPALMEPMIIPPEPTMVSKLPALGRPAGYRDRRPLNTLPTSTATSTAQADRLRKTLRAAQRRQALKSGNGPRRRAGKGLVTVFDA